MAFINTYTIIIIMLVAKLLIECLTNSCEEEMSHSDVMDMNWKLCTMTVENAIHIRFNFHWLSVFCDFCIIIFMVCDITAHPLPVWSKFRRMKLLQTATDPWKLRKFNPAKVKAYTVTESDALWLWRMLYTQVAIISSLRRQSKNRMCVCFYTVITIYKHTYIHTVWL